MIAPARVSLPRLMILILGLPAFAQSARGTITGVVRDPTGAVRYVVVRSDLRKDRQSAHDPARPSHLILRGVLSR